jgi:hypothetical protein
MSAGVHCWLWRLSPNPYWYGGLLVYEPLDSKWRRYHARCRQSGCTGDWLDHALKAGFRQVGKHQGYFGLVGPGLTEGVDESRLTANALWEAVTGIPGNQDWHETVHVVERDGMPMTGCEVCGGGLRCKEAGRTAGCAPSATGKPSPEARVFCRSPRIWTGGFFVPNRANTGTSRLVRGIFPAQNAASGYADRI